MRKIFLLMACVTALLLMIQTLHAQQKQVSGTILNEDDNTPLVGVTVTNKNSKQSTQSNSVGYYSIQAEKGDVIVFSHVGFVLQQMTVGDAGLVSLKLVPVNKSEQIVTVYGIKRSARELPYMAQQVKGDDIAQTKRENFINSLAGRIAGVNITPTSGTPGASSMIVLRGATSIGGSNQPLFVVDGVPYDNQTLNQENLVPASNASGVGFANRNSDYGNRAMDINPEDIETVTVLKGPEATALYGSDGSSGAIVITTKKGRSGKASISYNNSFRWEKVDRFPEVQKVYSRGANGVFNPNAVVNPFAGGNLISYFGPKYAPGTKFYDNFGAFFKTGFTQNHNINVEGGNEGLSYRISSGLDDQTGIVPHTAFHRVSFRASATAKVSPKIGLSTSMSYSGSKTDKAPKGVGGYFLNILNWPADVDMTQYLNADGTKKQLRGTSASTTDSDNPFWDAYKNTSQDKVDRFTSNFTINYDPAKWLNFGWITGLDYYSQKGDYVVHPQSRFGAPTGGFYSLYEQVTKNWNNVIKATGKKTWGKYQNALTIGATIDDNRTRVDAQRGEQFYEADFKSINNTAPTTRDAKTNIYNTRKGRLFANYTLGYDNILFFSLAGSREGASTLMSKRVDKVPFYNYGSASMSFVFTDLKVFDNIDWLNFGKARISYGTTGKAPIGAYLIDPSFVSQITTGGGYAFGVTGNNFGLKPEYTSNLEFGGELRFLKDRLSVDITHYDLHSKDQILAARSSYGTGFVLKYFNGGLVINKGLEIVLKGSPVRKKNFNWDITANFDHNKGTIKEMPAELPTYYDSDTWVFGNLRSQAYQGASTGNLSGSIYLKNTAGSFLINPTSGLLTSSGADFFFVGDREPDFKVGLINNFTYKNFSFNFNLDFRKGGDVWNGNEYFLFLTGLSKKTLDRETPIIITGVLNDGLQNTANPTPNNIVITPFYRSDYYGAGVVTESDFIEKVNWMRLRDATVSYSLSKRILDKQHFFKSATVYVTGTDLFMVTNYSGADPSVNSNTAFARGFGGAGIDYGTLATPRGILFGLNVRF
jgi:ferric enterobactin receptor